ncbi:hypothetical protein ABH931_004283 [Streptacidiphilus sp. MAP12-33]|uniref:DUF4232 domain-containing protein n=1 Tax=Streptacidiphilus sp. MAP12-33 TaxID=3156266 RepID=UPI0035138373
MTGSADRFDREGGAGADDDPFAELHNTPVEPMPIPEGAFAQVRQRAARRRRRRAALGATAGMGAVALAVYLTGAFVPHGPAVVVTPPASPGPSLSGTPRPLPSGTTPSAAPSVPATPSASAPSSAAASATPTTRPSASASPAGTPLCTAAQLTPRLGAGNAGAGQIYTYLVVTNHSATACHVTGFPGLSLLDASGHQIGVPATYTYLPEQPVVLAPGASASDTIHTVNRQSNDPSQCLPTSVSLRIYPPGSRASLVFPGRITVCLGTFEVTPFGPGSTGNPAN